MLYTRPFAAHLFLREKPRAEEVADWVTHHFDHYLPEWQAWRTKENAVRYVGYEPLPLKPTYSGDTQAVYLVYLEPEPEEGDYYENPFRIERWEILKPLDPSLIEALLGYRQSWFTLDIDDDRPSLLRAYIDEVRERGITDIQVTKTHRGYHLRARLDPPRTIDEILDLRQDIGDDRARVFIDRAYHQHKPPLDFLTNLLLTEKWWREEREEGGGWQYYKEAVYVIEAK